VQRFEVQLVPDPERAFGDFAQVEQDRWSAAAGSSTSAASVSTTSCTAPCSDSD